MLRTLRKNEQTFYYSKCLGKTELLDDNGYRTGVRELSYDVPVKAYGNISANTGEVIYNTYGKQIAYDRILQPRDSALSLDENDVLYLDSDYSSGKYDYVIVSVIRSLNVLKYAIRKVNVGVDNEISA
jgi:hypothetical protein